VKLSDLIISQDGSLSLTKLAATAAHLNAAGWFAWLTWQHGFNEMLWMIYLGATIFHAAYDKTGQMVKDFKEKKLGADNAGA